MSKLELLTDQPVGGPRQPGDLAHPHMRAVRHCGGSGGPLVQPI